MAFVISKKSTLRGRTRNLYYLVESFREAGKVKRRTICCLGESDSLKSALRRLESEVSLCLGNIDRCKDEIAGLRRAARDMAKAGVPFGFNRPKHESLVKRIGEEGRKMLELKEQRAKVVELIEEHPLL